MQADKHTEVYTQKGGILRTTFFHIVMDLLKALLGNGSVNTLVATNTQE
jgi:hypothetical protein